MTELARERASLAGGIPGMATFVSLRPVVAVVPAEIYPVSRVVAVRVGEPALREREETYEYGAERRVRVGLVVGGVISPSSSPASSSSGGPSTCGGCVPCVLRLQDNRQALAR